MLAKRGYKRGGGRLVRWRVRSERVTDRLGRGGEGFVICIGCHCFWLLTLEISLAKTLCRLRVSLSVLATNAFGTQSSTLAACDGLCVC